MLVYLTVLLFFLLTIAAATSPTKNEPFKANSAEYVQTSPVWLKDVKVPTRNVVKGYPREEDIQEGPLHSGSVVLDKNSYPVLNKQPPTDHPEVQAVINLLDFSQIPPAPTRKVKDWILDINDYSRADPDCWWSASLCKKPKVSYIPEDISYCPNPGDWGLNYDDGPYKNLWPRTEKDKEFDQPRFYNFLVGKKKQKATLFFVGSNVVNFPEAAQRALNDGHTICSHTWSHPQMTSLTNEEVVAQLYWTQKAIKEALGITPKCWRPPYGDVDDRVRAIAWQMGMRTILWDQDSNDWNLFVTEGRGHLKGEVIDGYFENWIKNRAVGNDTAHGHITLEHENSNVTITMSEKWLPKLQETFNVMPIHQCINDPKPYWEDNWVYPTLENPDVERFSVPQIVVEEQPASSNALAVAKTFVSLILLGFVTFAIML